MVQICGMVQIRFYILSASLSVVVGWRLVDGHIHFFEGFLVGVGGGGRGGGMADLNDCLSDDILAW